MYLRVVDEVPATGSDDAGMSGGCEWRTHKPTEAEYTVLREELAERGCQDVEPPLSVRTRQDYNAWKNAPGAQ